MSECKHGTFTRGRCPWCENDQLRQALEAKLDREVIADVQHEIWSSWMRWMFSVGQYQNIEFNGTVQRCWVMPNHLVRRWERQAKTPYSELTPQEKDSDREQADKVIAALSGGEGNDND